jgi:hypothetical protein
MSSPINPPVRPIVACVPAYSCFQEKHERPFYLIFRAQWNRIITNNFGSIKMSHYFAVQNKKTVYTQTFAAGAGWASFPEQLQRSGQTGQEEKRMTISCAKPAWMWGAGAEIERRVSHSGTMFRDLTVATSDDSVCDANKTIITGQRASLPQQETA